MVRKGKATYTSGFNVCPGDRRIIIGIDKLIRVLMIKGEVRVALMLVI